MERGALKAHSVLIQLFGFLDCGGRANAERERHQALLGRNRFRLPKSSPNICLVGKD